MGCDIHSVAQVHKDGQWRTVAHRLGEDDRNYDTFAVYANVRNGMGFAGCDTGEGWRIIAEPRGLPNDFDVWEESHHGTWMGDHSHSWLTLAEIQKAWDGYSTEEYEVHGIVERKHYEATLAKGQKPKEWCGGKSGRDVLIVDEAQVKGGTAPKGYTDVSCAWKVPASARLWMMEKQLKELQYIAEEHEVDPDKVRLVFGFDS